MNSETKKIETTIRETPKFRIEASNEGVRIISKLSQPYKVLSLSYQDLTTLLILIDSIASEVAEKQAKVESSVFRPVPLV